LNHPIGKSSLSTTNLESTEREKIEATCCRLLVFADAQKISLNCSFPLCSIFGSEFSHQAEPSIKQASRQTIVPSVTEPVVKDLVVVAGCLLLTAGMF